MLCEALLRSGVRKGELIVIDATGTTHAFCGSETYKRVVIRLHDKRLDGQILLNPHMAIPEAYVDGRLTIEEGTPYDFFDLCVTNLALGYPFSGSSLVEPLARLTRRFHQLNDMRRARRNVAHHYDLSGRLYELFLDSEREYTCAYFPTGSEDIEAAQRAKERHIAAKLLLRPGQRVVDLGCGWGALGRHLAAEHGADVTGVTLSAEQHRWANERACAQGLDRVARFRHMDYREVEGTFDRVVSIGMIEHVGVSHYDALFHKVRDLMAADGVALIHGIGRKDGPSYNHAWLRKYIFPGSYAPALSEVLAAIERSKLWVTDVEVLRLHYAYTLQRWREKFYANWDKAKALYDERFCRMWEVYLIGTELFFTRLEGFIFQIQLAKDREAVPLTRDYIDAAERRAEPESVSEPAKAAE